MRIKNVCRGLGCLMLALVGLAALRQDAFTQATTATISGTVKDETGAVAPAAGITATNLDTGFTRTAVSDSGGRYHVPNLPLGKYQVQVSLTGFETAVRSGIELTVGREAIVDLTLKLGAVSEKVVVTGEAPLVETTSSTVSGLVSENQMRELPLNGRDFTQLALLETAAVNLRSTDQALSKGFGTRISLAGSRPDQTAYMLDGTDISSTQNFSVPGSVAGVVLGVEAVREFRVSQSNFSAEFGGSSGGVINIVSKTGTNQIHGSAFEFVRNNNFDARNFFDPGAPPQFKRNQFGGSGGGPIKKDKTFVFGSYEGFRERLGLSLVSVVPDLDARQGRLPSGTVVVAPEVKPYLNLFPVPTGSARTAGAASVALGGSRPTNENYYTVRGDHTLSNKNSFFGRYTLDSARATQPDGLSLFNVEQISRTQYITLEDQHFFRSNLFNVFRFAFNRSRAVSGISAAKPIDHSLFILAPDRIPTISIAGFTLLGPDDRDPQGNLQNIFQYQDSLAYNKGRHSVKLGFNAERIQFQTNGGPRTGTLTFGSLQSFLTDAPSQTFAIQAPGSDSVRNLRQSIIAWYLQDDFNIKSNLTLNLGMRHEFTTTPTEINNHLATVIDPLHDTLVHVGNPYWKNPSLKNFGPRVGFSWDPFSNGKTAVRGGFGMFFVNLTPRYYRTPAVQNPPFARIFNIANQATLANAVAVLQDFSARTPPSTTLTPAIFLQIMDYNLSPSYEMKWNFTLEREILPNTNLTAGYIAGRGVHLTRISGVNIPPEIKVGGRAFIPAGTPSPNPNAGTLQTKHTDVQSFYNALQLKLDRRFSHGISLRAAYTFSKNIDDSSTGVAATDFTGVTSATSAGRTSDPNNPKAERGLSSLDIRHNLVVSYLYDLPHPHLSNALAAGLLSGWEASGIFSVSSGSPFPVAIGFENAPARARSPDEQRPDLVPGASNNPKLGKPERWFDPSSFVLPPPGFFGNLGRNTTIGPGFFDVDFGLIKNMPVKTVSENFQIQFRSEFFNLLNHTNFRIPQFITVFDAQRRRVESAGRITATSGASRQIQFGMKLIW